MQYAQAKVVIHGREIVAAIDATGRVVVQGANSVVIQTPINMIGDTAVFTTIPLRGRPEEMLITEIAPGNDNLRVSFHSAHSHAVREQPENPSGPLRHPMIVIEPGGTKNAPTLEFSSHEIGKKDSESKRLGSVPLVPTNPAS